MKNKLFGFIVCVLLIVAVVPQVISLKNDTSCPLVLADDQRSIYENWSQRQKLFASDGGHGEWFGRSVSLSGDTAVIGAALDNDIGVLSGSAYVYVKTDTIWTEQAKILPVDSDKNVSWFGCSVSLNEDTVLIGNMMGSAYVFVRTGTSWEQQAKLCPEDAPIWGFGSSVSLDGDTALIGAGLDQAAYIFTRIGTTWTQQAKLIASDVEPNEFCDSVSISGDTAIFGVKEDSDSGESSGSAYVFTRSGTTWSQQAKLIASDGGTMDWFGYSVSLSGNTALISAPAYYSIDTGFVYVFVRSGSTWTQQAKLISEDGAIDDRFGGSVSLDGDRALIGAVFDASAYIYIRTGANWTQEAKLLASDGSEGDYFGFSVSLDKDTALIGAWNDAFGGAGSGSAYLFRKDIAAPDLKIDVTGGFGVHATITNTNMTAPVTNVEWAFYIRGGMLGKIDASVNGTIEMIDPGKSATVRTGLFFGLGPMHIIARARDTEVATTGKQFFVLSKMKE